MKNKTSLIVLILFAFFGSTNTFAQNEIYTELYNSFGEIPTSMSSTELKELGKHGKALKKQQSVILEDLLMTDNVIIPIGKVIKGKAVILIYALVERKDIGEEVIYIHVKTKTLHKKTGELISSSSHLLDIGSGGPTAQYDGSIKRNGDDLIEFHQISDVDGVEELQVAQYEFGKYLEFVQHLE